MNNNINIAPALRLIQIKPTANINIGKMESLSHNKHH